MHQVFVRISFFTFVFLINVKTFAQDCNCKTVLINLNQELKTNYVAYESKIASSTRFKKHYSNLLSKANNKKTMECYLLLDEYINFFKDYHIGVGINYSKINDEDFQNFPSFKVDTLTFNKRKDKDWIEGIWQVNDADPGYKILIAKTGLSKFVGVVLHSDFKNWRTWQVKMQIEKQGVHYKITYFTKNYGIIKQVVRAYSKDMFNLSGLFWIRSSVYNVENAKKTKNNDIGFERLSENTNLLTIRSFFYGNKIVLDSVLEENKESLRSAKNLIIDIRDNSGGNAGVYYSKLIDYIYTNPILKPVSVYKASTTNIKIYEPSANDTSERSKALIKKMSQNLGKLVAIDTVERYYYHDTTLEFPRKVAILINRKTASAAELFVLNFKNSKKVVIYGENTAGAIDNTNMTSNAILDCHLYNYSYATVTSKTSLQKPIDPTGISPNVKLNGYEYLWVNEVKKIIETK